MKGIELQRVVIEGENIGTKNQINLEVKLDPCGSPNLVNMVGPRTNMVGPRTIVLEDRRVSVD